MLTLFKISLKTLASLFIKYLKPVRKFHRIRINTIKRGGYILDQEEEIDYLLGDAGLNLVKITRTSIGDDSYEVSVNNEDMLLVHGREVQSTVMNFQALVGSLLWVSCCTRPKIAFAVDKATRKTNQPSICD